jgi:endoglucanase
MVRALHSFRAAMRSQRHPAVRCCALALLLSVHLGASAPPQGVFGNGRGLSIAALANMRPVNPSGALAYVVNPIRTAPSLYTSLQNAHFNLIRQVVNPLPLMQLDAAARDAAIKQVVIVIDQIRARNLTVVVDLHFWSSSTETAKTMLGDLARQERFTRGAVALARALAGRSGVALELLNEPPRCFPSTAVNWGLVQRRLVAQVRTVAPALPLVLTGCGGQLSGLLELDPAPYANDPNILYTFHFYEPFIFTHQQTYFGGRLRAVPYPPPGKDAGGRDASTMLPTAVLAARKETAAELNAYLHGNDSDTLIAARIDQAVAWAQRARIAPNRILLGEFGSTLSADADAGSVRADELHWLEVVRSRAEHAGFAWAYWSLPSPRDLDYDPATRFIRPDVLRALGLLPAVR